MPELEKSLASRLAVLLAPECGKTLAAFREKRDGWVKFPPMLEQARNNSGLGDVYVQTYDDERRIHGCAFRWAFPRNTNEEIKELDEELRQTPVDSILEWIDECAEDIDDELDALFNATDSEREEALKQFEAMSEEDRVAEMHRLQNLLAFIYAYFYSVMSLMVHGQKLTVLVPLAIQGDKEAFAKAVQVDRNLLKGHPYFRETFDRLQTGDDPDFLRSVLGHMGRPPLQGKIRFPTLYMVFAIIDSFGCLDDFTSQEILDICDKAGLDRFQNRIEDEGYLNKRRAEYRRFQRIPK